MPKKKKKTVWHKRREKFVPSSVVKPHASTLKVSSNSSKSDSSDKKVKKILAFKEDLKVKARKAVEESGGL